ncbi:hypothetical protein, partial [Escherichia coli]|uniref:hypothetical protein n=1 Tax=Escherichia coli TaxID=562 RepID=UPI002B24F490
MAKHYNHLVKFADYLSLITFSDPKTLPLNIYAGFGCKKKIKPCVSHSLRLIPFSYTADHSALTSAFFIF